MTYKIVEKIGTGSTYAVFKCLKIGTLTNEYYACRVIDENCNSVNDVVHEAAIMKIHCKETENNV